MFFYIQTFNVSTYTFNVVGGWPRLCTTLYKSKDQNLIFSMLTNLTMLTMVNVSDMVRSIFILYYIIYKIIYYIYNINNNL